MDVEWVDCLAKDTGSNSARRWHDSLCSDCNNTHAASLKEQAETGNTKLTKMNSRTFVQESCTGSKPALTYLCMQLALGHSNGKAGVRLVSLLQPNPVTR